MVLGALCLMYAVLQKSVQTEDVMECILVFCCCCLCGASVLDTFPLIVNDVGL